MLVTLYGTDHYGALILDIPGLQGGLEHLQSSVHRPGRNQHLRNKHLVQLKFIPDNSHTRQKPLL